MKGRIFLKDNESEYDRGQAAGTPLSGHFSETLLSVTALIGCSDCRLGETLAIPRLFEPGNKFLLQKQFYFDSVTLSCSSQSGLSWTNDFSCRI